MMAIISNVKVADLDDGKQTTIGKDGKPTTLR